jgi:predicted small lipoprotein YifL
MLYYKDFAMQRLLTALIALVAVSALLTGCGQKGPLFLPDETPASSQTE